MYFPISHVLSIFLSRLCPNALSRLCPSVLLMIHIYSCCISDRALNFIRSFHPGAAIPPPPITFSSTGGERGVHEKITRNFGGRPRAWMHPGTTSYSLPTTKDLLFMKRGEFRFKMGKLWPDKVLQKLDNDSILIFHPFWFALALISLPVLILLWGHQNTCTASTWGLSNADPPERSNN